MRRARGRVAGPAAVVLLPCLLAGCGSATSDARHVALPAAGAPPARVVAAYVAALDAHDVATAKALMTPRFRQLVEHQVDSWFTNTVSIRRLKTGAPYAVPGVGSSVRRRFVRYVPVQFDLEQRRQVSMRNGPTVWGYVLVRDRPPGRWLVDGVGVA